PSSSTPRRRAHHDTASTDCPEAPRRPRPHHGRRGRAGLPHPSSPAPHRGPPGDRHPYRVGVGQGRHRPALRSLLSGRLSTMPAPRPFIGDKDLHLIGRILDAIDDAVLLDEGFSPGERARAEWMFDDINRYLSERVGLDWNDVEAE